MATALQTVAAFLAQVELLDLRHFSAYQLRPLLLEEAELWEQRLQWEYRDAVELLLQYLDSRMLPGFAARYQGRVIGYTFCVYEGNKAVIGDIFISQTIEPAMGLGPLLLQQLLDMLDASPDLERVESQLLLYNAGELSIPFRRAGYTSFPRLYQECWLEGAYGGQEIPEGLELVAWTPSLYQAVAELIHAAYAGHVDALINDQYRTLHGSLRFLHNIVRFPGCGDFDPAASWLLRDRADGAIAGVVLSSRIGAETAHITQLCVGGEYRGRGVGGYLLDHVMGVLKELGYRTITLTVSEANEGAVRLYQRAGFRTRHHFEGMVLEKNPARFDLRGLLRG
jgi:ribosomal protein S18 acetylase RimI-like enzyme